MAVDSKEDKLLLAALADRQKQCEDKLYPTNSGFLDAHEQTLAADFVRNGAVFWGGYAEAERRCVVFLPDYMADFRQDFAAVDESLDPLAVLRVRTQAKETALSHRDYLGALMSLGIKRQKIGDIIVAAGGADIVIMRDMADYLLLNFDRVGRYTLEAEVLPCAAICTNAAPFKEFSANVPSLRLDTVAAAAFGVSRSVAVMAIKDRLVAVNSLQVAKPDFAVNVDDSLTWRGKGKAKLISIDGKSRKERIFLTIRKYI